jgi:cation diffusion facilitator family transporter
MRFGSAEHSPRDRLVARVLWTVLGVNVLVAVTKLVVGYRLHALALIADGLHSSLDASSNVVGLVGLAIATKPPDRGHPYGHRRFETLAALIIGLLIGAAFLEIVEKIVERVRGVGEAPRVSITTALIVTATIVINLLLSSYESRRGRALRSSVLEADSKHTLSDALAAGCVLVGFAGTALGWSWADGVAAIAVAVLIAYTAFKILSVNVAVLADHVRLDPYAVHAVATSVPGVFGAHRIRSRGSSDHVLLDLHVHLDPDLTLTEAHRKTHEVMDALKSAFPNLGDIVIHTEPADGREKNREQLAPGTGGEDARA